MEEKIEAKRIDGVVVSVPEGSFLVEEKVSPIGFRRTKVSELSPEEVGKPTVPLARPISRAIEKVKEFIKERGKRKAEEAI